MVASVLPACSSALRLAGSAPRRVRCARASSPQRGNLARVCYCVAFVCVLTALPKVASIPSTQSLRSGVIARRPFVAVKSWRTQDTQWASGGHAHSARTRPPITNAVKTSQLPRKQPRLHFLQWTASNGAGVRACSTLAVLSERPRVSRTGEITISLTSP